MFGKLKEKLRSFLGKTKKEEKKEKIAKAPKKDKKPKKELPTDEQLKEEAQKIDKEVPLQFEVGRQKYEPDTDAIKEKAKDDLQLQEQKVISEKKPSFLSRFAKKLTSSTRTLKQEHVDEIFEPLELILLENNVALGVVDKIRENLNKDLVDLEIKKSDSIQNTILNSLKESISSVLIEPEPLLPKIKSKLTPYTIVFFGINGSGKTTSIAKLAHKLKQNKISCVLAAADTFRAASIEQLEIHASRLKVPIVKSQYGADPTSVAFDAVQYANKNKIQCVLIDTAGRMYTKENLIKEMEKLIRKIKPDLKIFVGESITGNDAVEQAKKFNDAIGIDGIILSKADVDEKGGTALSVSHVTGKPIYFLGTGQSYADLQDFKKQTILENLGLD